MEAMKKRLIWAVAVIMICLLAAGCGKSGYDMKEVAEYNKTGGVIDAE